MLIYYSLTALLPLTLLNVVLAAPRPESLSTPTPTPTATSAPPSCSVNCPSASTAQPFTARSLDRRDTAGNDAPSSTTTAPPMPSSSPAPAPTPTMQARSVPSPTAVVTRRSVSGKRSLQRRIVVGAPMVTAEPEPTPHANVIQRRVIKPRDAPSLAQPAATVPAPTPLPRPTPSRRRA